MVCLSTARRRRNGELGAGARDDAKKRHSNNERRAASHSRAIVRDGQESVTVHLLLGLDNVVGDGVSRTRATHRSATTLGLGSVQRA